MANSSSLAGSMASMRISTKLEKSAEEKLAACNMQPLAPIMADKIGETPRGDVPLTTNVYGVMLADKFVYRYDVEIKGKSTKSNGTESIYDLTDKVKGDAPTVERRMICRDLFLTFKNENLDFFDGDDKTVYNDLHSILFSLNKLKITDKTTFPIKKIPDSCAFMNLTECHVIIKMVNADSFELPLGKFTNVNSDLRMSDHLLSQFIDIATSQAVFFTKDQHITFSTSQSYLLDPLTHNLTADLPYFKDTDSYLSYGAQKSVRFIEGPKEKSCAASLVIETKKTAFHSVSPLLTKAKCFIAYLGDKDLSEGDFNKLNKFFKRLYVQTVHGKRRQRFFIKSLSTETAKTKIVNVKGIDVSIEQYFFDTYSIQLKYPTLPLIETAGRDGTRYFPIEVCEVCDNQRVKTEQQTPNMTQQTIKKCAVPPLQLMNENQKTAHSLFLWQSEYLDKANIKVVKDPVSLFARNIQPPAMEFANKQIVPVNNKSFGWQGRGFMAPVTCNIWAAYAFMDRQDKLSQDEFQEFIKRFIMEARQQGMVLPDPADFDIKDSRSETIRDTFRIASQNGCGFVFTVHSDFGDDAHADIKYSERKFSLVSQALRLITLRNVITKNQRLTLSNIVNKTNIKLGGLNYNVANNTPNAKYVLSKEVLYIGFAMNHPGGGLGMTSGSAGDSTNKSPKVNDTPSHDSTISSPPSVVGYAANVGPNSPFDFVGDFVYQEPLRDEKVETVQMIVERCIVQFMKTRGGATPKRIILYRNGCSEGQFKNVLTYEVPLIKAALIKLNCKDSLLTIIVANKLQNIRFFNKNVNPNDRVPDQNVQPGTVIDHTVVHPCFAEFFLNSHRALQGTTRIPKYTILYDESKMQMSQIEAITYQLCFGHQIIFSPVSLPSPIFIANRYSERGRMLYQRYMHHEGTRDLTYTRLNAELNFFENDVLFGRRVNA